MNASEAKEIYDLILQLFSKIAAERAFRLQSHMLDSGLDLSRAKELVYRHRETHEFLTEKNLLDELAKALGKPINVDGGKIAAEQLRKDRLKKEKELQEAIAADEEACKKKLLELGPEEIRLKHPGAAVVLKRLGLLPREGLVFGEVLTGRESVQA